MSGKPHPALHIPNSAPKGTQELWVEYRANETLGHVRTLLAKELGYLPRGMFQVTSPDRESLQPISENFLVKDVVDAQGYICMEEQVPKARVAGGFPVNGHLLPGQTLNELSVGNMSGESTAFSGNRYFDPAVLEHMGQGRGQANRNVGRVGYMDGKSRVHVGDIYGYDNGFH